MIELRITLGSHVRPQRAANGARPPTPNLRPARMDGLQADVFAALIATLPPKEESSNVEE